MCLKELSPASTTASPVETRSISWAFKCRRNTVLVLLVTQITLSALLMRYSRTHAPEGHRYRASVAVVMTEAMKLPIALLLAGCTLGSPRALMDLLRNELPTRSTLKCAVPAFAYTLQGNLLFVATANLETPTFQVTYQTKTLFTALFSVLMLGRRLVPSQWAALFLLFGGTVLATDLSGSGGGRERSTESAALGLSAVIIAALLSASSSVYFEMVLKQESLPDSYASSGDLALWTRNIQLGSFALPLSLLAAALQDGRHIMRVGPLQVHAKRRVQTLLTPRDVLSEPAPRAGCRLALASLPWPPSDGWPPPAACAGFQRHRLACGDRQRTGWPAGCRDDEVCRQHRQVLRDGARHHLGHVALGAHLRFRPLAGVPRAHAERTGPVPDGAHPAASACATPPSPPSAPLSSLELNALLP